MGGLGNVDWSAHVSSFMSQWITRYVDPAESQWKDILDSFLLRDKRGRELYPEGRGKLFCKLSVAERYRMMRSLPTKATYVRECPKALKSRPFPLFLQSLQIEE